MTTKKSIQGSEVVVDNISVIYDSREKIVAIQNFFLKVERGEFICLLGISGCGKSTILNTIAGFIKPTFGTILVDNVEVKEPNPSRGMVFQQHTLFPWLTVLGNIQFGPLSRGIAKNESYEIAMNYIKLIGLEQYTFLYPNELSGGMQQRVGLARVLANQPSLLLMDEPFGSLDAQTRIEMQELLLDIWADSGTTVIFVTHDIEEATLLSDRLVVLSARPGTVKEEIKVPLPRPRTYEKLSNVEFLDIKRRAFQLIREEKLKNALCSTSKANENK